MLPLHSMVLFKQLITVLSQYHYKPDIFDEAQLENTSLHRLYKGIQTGEYTNDTIAAMDLYQKRSTHSPYRKLKSILRSKLLNRLFFLHIDENTHSEMQIIHYQILRQIFFMKALAGFGALEAASVIAGQIAHQAERFHLTEAVIDSLTILQQYTSYAGQQIGFEKYTEQLHHYRNVYIAECRASEIIQQCVLRFGKSRSAPPALVAYISTVMDEVLGLWEKFKTHTLALHLFRIQIYHVQSTGDYKQGLAICTSMETFFTENGHLASNARFVEIAIYKNLSYLFLRQYETAMSEIPRYLSYLSEGSNNWFTFMEDYLLILLHSGHINEARSIMNTVIRHRAFDGVNSYRKELWSIYDVYISYCEGNRSGRILEIISQLTTVSHDKSAVYTAILAMQILIMINTKQYRNICDRDEYLKKYISRYLSTKNNARGRAFFHSIRIAIKKQFNKQETLQTAHKNIALLHDRSILLDDFEVLPYEKMWQYVEDSLY
jgi:hypothetical protein